MISSKRAAIAWLMVAAWAAFIFYMSAHTGDDLSDTKGILGVIKQWIDDAQLALFGPGIELTSSAAHFAEYAVLGALLFRAVNLSEWRKPGSGADDATSFASLAFSAVTIAGLYGITDEIHQLFIPGRFCDPMDWLVEVVSRKLV